MLSSSPRSVGRFGRLTVIGWDGRWEYTKIEIETIPSHQSLPTKYVLWYSNYQAISSNRNPPDETDA